MRNLVLVGPGFPDHQWSHEVESFGAAEEAALERGDIDEAVEIDALVLPFLAE